MRLKGSPAWALCAWLLITSATGAQQNPPQPSAPPIPSTPLSPDDQRLLLARVGREAIRYQRELPDFL
jgi:hypothetical protein